MSDSAQYHATEDAHTGPIKNPKQLLLAVFFSFIVPILIIVGLVSYVVSGTKPSGAAQRSSPPPRFRPMPKLRSPPRSPTTARGASNQRTRRSRSCSRRGCSPTR